MIKQLNKAKAIARKRAEETDRVQYVAFFEAGDADDQAGYMVMDVNGLEDWHVPDRDIVYATA